MPDRRLLIPSVLAALGFGILSGCIYLPTSEKTVRGTNVSAKVGKRDSSKPIRIGVTSRDQILDIVGAPAHASPDQTRLTYVWQVHSGVWFWPLCFFLGPDAMTHPQAGRRALTLSFDSRGILQAATVPKDLPANLQIR